MSEDEICHDTERNGKVHRIRLPEYYRWRAYKGIICEHGRSLVLRVTASKRIYKMLIEIISDAREVGYAHSSDRCKRQHNFCVAKGHYVR